MSFAQDLRNKVFAGALSIGLAFGAAAPAIAQDTNANENVQETSLLASLQTVTAEEAKELSKPEYEGGPGSVVLLVGEDFNKSILVSLTRYLTEHQNYNVSVYEGGDKPGHLQLFAGGGALPDYFDESNVLKLPHILGLIVEQHNLDVYAKNDSAPEADGPA